MPVFEDQQPTMRPAKKKSWPIKLAMRAGCKTEASANTVVILVSVVLLIITAYMYTQVIFGSPEPAQAPTLDLTPEQQQLLEASRQ
jgi:hypothetical protein